MIYCACFTGAGSGATVTREDKVKQILDEIIEKLPEEFNMVEIMNKVEERTPYGPQAFVNIFQRAALIEFSLARFSALAGISLWLSRNVNA